MKKILSYTFVALLGALSFSACTNEYEYDGAGQAENANAAGVYFSERTYAKSIEVEPGAEYFDVSLSRNNAGAAQTVGISVVEDEDGVFDVPSSVTFAEGETTALLHVTAPNAQEGQEYSLTIGIAENEAGIYTAGMQQYTINMAVQKWEKLGTGYLVDGTVSQFYGVDPTLAYAVEIDQLTTETGYRFRFVGPFSHAATAKDELGAFIGYPYNPGKGDEEDHLFMIDVTSAGASLKPVSLGIDWGYGVMSIGSIYGYLSTDIESYPLGTYNAKAGVITFPVNSLFIQDDDGPAICKKNPTYLYLSAEAYIASLTEE